MIGILDAGMGNLRSVSNAVYNLGFDFIYVDKPDKFDGISHLILPGVGAFGTAMRRLEQKKIKEAITKFKESGRPLLGLCLGMQLLADFGTEGGSCNGLGFVSGSIGRLPNDINLPIPHVGWNTVNFQTDHPLFHGVKNGVDFYFVHSYHFVCNSAEDVYGQTDYDRKFTSIVGNKNVVGFQFHPEKSQVNGLKLLENFCNWDGAC